MTPQEQIRKLAEDAALECFPATNATDLWMSKRAIEAAIREGVKLALAGPSESELREIAYRSKVWPTINTAPDAIIEAIRIYLNAAAGIRLRELGVEE